jgi:GNAT superfamily N-acetyltransferase
LHVPVLFDETKNSKTMEKDTEKNPAPVFAHVEPVLAVKNVPASVAYWQDVLGFPDRWIWDPPTLGGVSWRGAAFLQFSEEPELAETSVGNSVWIRMRNIDTLYALHQRNGAVIADPLQLRSWAFKQYTIRDINGYNVHFAEAAKAPSLTPVASPVRIVLRLPTIAEQTKITVAVGWSRDAAEIKTPQAMFRLAVVAEDVATGEAVGCAFLVGDNLAVYYIRDVMVLPDWQGCGIGTALVQGLVDWLKEHAQPKAVVGLFTGDHLVAFYRQFGFTQAVGMYREVGDL